MRSQWMTSFDLVRGLARGDVTGGVAPRSAQSSRVGRDRPDVQRAVPVEVRVRGSGKRLTVVRNAPDELTDAGPQRNRGGDRRIDERVLADALVRHMVDDTDA